MSTVQTFKRDHLEMLLNSTREGRDHLEHARMMRGVLHDAQAAGKARAAYVAQLPPPPEERTFTIENHLLGGTFKESILFRPAHLLNNLELMARDLVLSMGPKRDLRWCLAHEMFTQHSGTAFMDCESCSPPRSRPQRQK